MMAITIAEFGGPEVLTFDAVPVPVCGAGEVQVRVHAAGVGPWDAWVRSGQSAVTQPLPLIPGSDVSGVVHAIGEAVTAFAIGDAVFGATNSRFTNGYAEIALCEEAMIAHKPRRLSHPEAASVPVIAVTAWQMLFDHAKLTNGQRVLIHGARGNVGRLAVQLAEAAGLEVLATGKSAAGAGASEEETLVDIARPTAQVHAAIDLVGGESQKELFDWVQPGGCLISAVTAPDQELADKRDVRASFILVDVTTRILDELAERFDNGALQPWVGEILPLSEVRAAHEMLEGGRPHAPGKIVLIP